MRNPTFAEREGAKALPSQLKLQEVNPEVRARAWQVIHSSLEYNKKYVSGSGFRVEKWEAILRDSWILLDYKFSDEFNPDAKNVILLAKVKIQANYALFLEFIEFVVSHRHCPAGIESKLNSAFEAAGFAYRIADKVIILIANEQMAQSVSRSLDVLGDQHLGARGHLNAAAKFLTSGDYANSVRESIHSVESVARRICPTANTLGPALTEFEKNFRLHPALKKAFLVLYGYTSDEEGVRHALIENAGPRVSEAEALYMLGSCSSFAALLAESALPSEIAAEEG